MMGQRRLAEYGQQGLRQLGGVARRLIGEQLGAKESRKDLLAQSTARSRASAGEQLLRQCPRRVLLEPLQDQIIRRRPFSRLG
jgi:hypothetical protein